MRWAEIALTAPPASTEPISAVLTEAGCAGVVIEDPNAVSSDPFAEWVLRDEARPTPTKLQDVRIKAYLPVDDRLEAALDRIQSGLEILREADLDPGNGITLRHVDDESWADAWKAFFKPLRVGERFVVKPSWEAWEAAPTDLIIEIDPGMAFGSGSHATTRLCLQLLERSVRTGERVLDWGTGSGILAVGAARLGAREVMAIDLDPVAARVAGENAALNGFGEVVQSGVASIEAVPADPPFDRVIANIVPDPIIAGAPEIAAHLRPGGEAIVSGIIEWRAAEVLAALDAAGLELEETLVEEDWRAFRLRRR
jgi:ribosomal protein L11 methyltransferase